MGSLANENQSINQCFAEDRIPCGLDFHSIAIWDLFPTVPNAAVPGWVRLCVYIGIEDRASARLVRLQPLQKKVHYRRFFVRQIVELHGIARDVKQPDGFPRRDLRGD